MTKDKVTVAKKRRGGGSTDRSVKRTSYHFRQSQTMAVPVREHILFDMATLVNACTARSEMFNGKINGGEING